MALESMVIEGPVRLNGEVQISGAKNAALPLMALSLLTDQPCTLKHVPRLRDINSMLAILNSLGVVSEFTGNTLKLHTPKLLKTHAPYEDVRKMRASVLVLGPLLARSGKARVSMPGGCAIGVRPIDLHLKAFESMGALIEMEQGDVVASLKSAHGGSFTFSKVTVTGTINALMVASSCVEEVTFYNCAVEPEVTQIVHVLKQMGVTIQGHGTSVLSVLGVKQLKGFDAYVIPDRIEAGTYMIGGAITGGDVTVKGVDQNHLKSLIDALKQMGVGIEVLHDDSIRVFKQKELRPLNIKTDVYPGFPTDMQAQLVALMTQVHGESLLQETIFENRFMHVSELIRMGADIWIQGNKLMVKGKAQLHGAPVMATDLRASASLILAGLVAKGKTQVNRIYHLDRGYEAIEDKLSNLGAKIKRIQV